MAGEERSLEVFLVFALQISAVGDFQRRLTGVLKYWGGLKDLEEELRTSHPGQRIFTAAVGPFRQVKVLMIV